MCNPDFQYHLITDADRYRILQEHFPSLVSVMTAYPHAIQRADLIQYVLLYVYGGIYLDLDYVCLRNLGPLLELPPDRDVGLVPSSNLPSQVTNSVIVSRPQAAFWLQVIDASRKPEQRSVHSTTVPWRGSMVGADETRSGISNHGVSRCRAPRVSPAVCGQAC